jgi:enoyl-CoA hydratase/carnithine racemase
MASLEREGELFVLDLGDTENRFTLDAIREVNAALDEVAAADGPRALVTKATGKIWSNGLDLDWLLAHPDDSRTYVGDVQEIFVKFLTLPVPTVAAIGGHAFAAGMMMALSHDFRIMRSDRGFLCLPEVDLQIPFTWGMSALIAARLTPQVAHEAMVTGKRYGGELAAALAIVDQAVSEDEVLTVAKELIAPLAGKAGPSMGTIKKRLYAEVIRQLRSVNEA